MSWQKLKQSFLNIWTEEWTALYGWTKVAVGGSWYVFGQILHDSDFKSSIPALNLPAWIPATLAVLGVLTLLSMEHKDT